MPVSPHWVNAGEDTSTLEVAFGPAFVFPTPETPRAYSFTVKVHGNGKYAVPTPGFRTKNGAQLAAERAIKEPSIAALERLGDGRIKARVVL